MMTSLRHGQRGLTIIELIVTVAILGILVSLAAPSFNSFIAKRRIEGVMNEFVTDLQYARSEAVQRNANVRVTLGTGCYVVHLASATAVSCTQTTKSVTPAAAELKTVQMAASSTVQLAGGDGLAFIEFDFVRGSAAFNGTDTLSGKVAATSTIGDWQLTAAVQPVGRVRMCSPNGSLAYPSTC
jgi:type IV fimbrial biogenesis protein FimT